MKAPSDRDFSVFSHLGNLGPCSEQTLIYDRCKKISIKWESFIE